MNKSCICHAMQTLQIEQKVLSGNGMEFQFICKSKKLDTIPFVLFSNELKEPFRVRHKCMATPFFRLEKLDEKTCCAVLSLLEAVDMDGCPTDSYDDFYALRKTKTCIIVNLNCFCGIQPLEPELVNRKLPVIEPKV